MAEKAARKHDWGLLAIGTVFAGGGLYFVLSGLELAPLLGHLNGPLWLALAIGLVFFAAGLSVLIRGWLALPDDQSNLPADTPTVFVVIQWLAVLTIVAGLASVATWIAFGPGERHFSTSVSFAGATGGGAGSGTIGRIAFGFGAVITWLMFAVMAYTGAGKIFGKKR